MQITLELPDSLCENLKSLPDPNGFILRVLSESLDVKKDPWRKFLENIELHAVETGIADLAENHDQYLYQMLK
jgi:hypothetical protein